MNEKEIIACVTLLAGALRQELTAPLLQGFCMALADLTAAELRQAVGRALCECKFMPAPAELRAFAGRPALSARGPEAWLAVRTAMDRYDYTDSVDFGPLVNAVVRDLGGWQYLCDQSVPDLVWREKEFIAKFQDRAQRPVDPARGLALRGSLPGAPLRLIAAPGSDAPRALPAREAGQIADVVRELAQAKGIPSMIGVSGPPTTPADASTSTEAARGGEAAVIQAKGAMR